MTAHNLQATKLRNEYEQLCSDLATWISVAHKREQTEITINLRWLERMATLLACHPNQISTEQEHA